MSTNNLSWTIGSYGPTISGQQVFYGKKLIATGNPDSGTGWTSYSGNPLANNAVSASIAAITDNVKYRFLHRTINTPVGGDPQNCTFKEVEDIKYDCGSLTNDSLVSGTLTFTHAAPASVTDAGSEIDSVEIILTGFDAANNTTTFAKKVLTPAAAVAGGTDTFTDVVGDKSWKLFKRLKDNSGNILQDCNLITFNTTGAVGNRIIYFRNGLYTGSINSILIENVDPPTVERLVAAFNPVEAGNTYIYDAVALGATPQYIKVGLTGIANGTQLYAIYVRAGAELYSEEFTYNGPDSLIFTNTSVLESGDTVNIMMATRKGFLPLQTLVTKKNVPTNGYEINVQIFFERPENNYFDVTFTAVNNNGGIETFTIPVTVVAGNLYGTAVFQASGFTPAQYAKTTIANSCVLPQDELLEVPATLLCSSL